VTAKRLLLQSLGWVVLVAGLLALVLPGPGLLLTLAGLAILSTQYTWARRMVQPVQVRAWRGTYEGVRTVPRIVGSVTGALVLGGLGLLWVLQPAAPSWWPVAERWWLFGGPGAGITMIASAAVALALLGYAMHRFSRPGAVAEVEEMERRHEERVAARREAKHRLHRIRRSRRP
jgi:hypothetical protein